MDLGESGKASVSMCLGLPGGGGKGWLLRIQGEAVQDLCTELPSPNLQLWEELL